MTNLASFPTSSPAGVLASSPSVGVVQKVASFPGVVTAFVSSVDTPRNSPPGDLDIRVLLSLADWNVLGADMCLICKQQVTGQKSFLLKLDNNGRPQFLASNTGAADDINQVAAGAIPAADNQYAWVRVVANATTGAINFFYSLDGLSWVSHGGGASLFAGAFDSSAAVVLGVENSVSSQAIPFTGLIARGIIYAGLDNSAPIAADFNANDYISGTTLQSLTTKEIWGIAGTVSISNK